ncbi:hypothetical protein Aph01nite_10790 [Acrocarpospora phusangensis]|uniref:Hydantoinase/oxoprolinase N-terminal domain-containing protein n=1 Tax=Acrocarpospora phusangensis TaxID=1070424 RepID=A0A919Q5K1_9ACTN|nr:hydantoinase/oxoprolinase N-terminal domain-containing protein [Acrocarpospora phusangensis]GIH22769.1 hypothetical protein Aph01nite_10790 [Acrocarpospora phusangensis]
MTSAIRFAVDIGGTFVDAIACDEATGGLRPHKAPTTPGSPARGVLDAVGGPAGRLDDVEAFVDGTAPRPERHPPAPRRDVGISTDEGRPQVSRMRRAVW